MCCSWEDSSSTSSMCCSWDDSFSSSSMCCSNCHYLHLRTGVAAAVIICIFFEEMIHLHLLRCVAAERIHLHLLRCVATTVIIFIFEQVLWQLSSSSSSNRCCGSCHHLHLRRGEDSSSSSSTCCNSCHHLHLRTGVATAVIIFIFEQMLQQLSSFSSLNRCCGSRHHLHLRRAAVAVIICISDVQ